METELLDSTRIEPERLREFFNPKSVALVGATDKSMWSVNTLENLKKTNFPGPIYLVNPRKETVLGESAYPSLLAIHGPVDLAFIMVPTQAVLCVMEDCAKKNIRNLVVLTDGFSEKGEEGKVLEEKIVQFAREHDQILLGPNGNGFVNVSNGIAPYGLPIVTPLQSGPVGIVLQSGGLASSVLDLQDSWNINLSFITSMGSEAMISATDIIDYLIEDEKTKVIALFLESIREPAEFARVARKALERGKPIVAFKIGRSEQSARAAMAHTGALVGDDAVNDAVFRQLGVIRVHSLEDLMTTAGLLGYYPGIKGPRAGIVTASGGACDILADRAVDEELELPAFQPETVKKLEQIAPGLFTAHNPLDITGYADGPMLTRAIKVAAEDPGLDFILCLVEPPKGPENLDGGYDYEGLADAIKNTSMRIIPFMNAAIHITQYGKEVATNFNVHFLNGMEHGMKAIGHAVWYSKLAEKRTNIHASGGLQVEFKISDGESAVAIGEWPEYRARKFLEEKGVPVVPGVIVNSADEAAAAAKNVGFPVVLKIQSSDIAHKSDIGGVALNLETEAKVREAFATMIDNVTKRAPGSKLDGVLVSPMRSEGIELLVGIVRDPLWGYVLAVGLGGVFVEVLKDTSLRVLPVDQAEIKSMLTELRGSAILEGVRGRMGADLDRVAEVVHHITKIVWNNSDKMEELEINPLWVKGKNVEALDALIRWK